MDALAADTLADVKRLVLAREEVRLLRAMWARFGCLQGIAATRLELASSWTARAGSIRRSGNLAPLSSQRGELSRSNALVVSKSMNTS